MYFRWIFFVVLPCTSLGRTLENTDGLNTNATGAKDMYVVRATVYQVGILTNRTNETDTGASGRQETITFYRNNGTSIDLNALPKPLVTNVTAENIVGVLPVRGNTTLPWTHDPQVMNNRMQGDTYNSVISRLKRDIENATAQITRGAAVIPSVAGVSSIALPPLLTLNKNMSEIPVPIPNVSVVSYAKVNTLIHSP